MPVGILAYLKHEPIGWCSIAPKKTFRKLDDLNLNEDKEETRLKRLATLIKDSAQRRTIAPLTRTPKQNKK